MKSDSAHSDTPQPAQGPQSSSLIGLEVNGDDAVDFPSTSGGPQSRLLRNLARTLKFSDVNTPENIKARLGAVRRFDILSERKQRLWMTLMVATAAAAIVSVFITGSRAKGAPIFWAIPVMLIIAGIVCGGLYLRQRRRNLDDRRYQIAEELVHYLSHDMSRESPLRVEIDFNGYRNNRYKTGSTGSILNSIEYSASYVLPWLSVNGSLLDGSRFRFRVEQVVKRKTKRKRKYTKVREAFHAKITLIIQVKPKQYGRIDGIPTLIRRSQLPGELRLSKADVIGNRVIVQAVTSVSLRKKGRYGTTGEDADQRTCDHHTLLGLFLACYHCLAQCRARR